MNIAAYCRVSTEKEDQLNSLETQKAFFEAYAQRNGHTLVRVYADEGISGTKLKIRKQFQKMLSDAESGLFQMLAVKDISRFARNTVDFLQSVRRLKALGIETQFITANMTNMGDSEFILTIFAALAQEESANTSKRIKFTKKINAEKGRVPNIVYGYDKTKGDYFDLRINQREAGIVREIYRMYVFDGLGTCKVAAELNRRGLKTKRGYEWSQEAVTRILSNALYTGRIINGKEEITDFLTGRRTKKDASEWFVVDRPDLRIVDQALFARAQILRQERASRWKQSRERHSSRHLFSTLIKCADCGSSFRRTVKTYRNTYVRWVCTGHNLRGSKTCANSVAVEETELIEVLNEYFASILAEQDGAIPRIVNAYAREIRERSDRTNTEKALKDQLAKLLQSRQKYMDMYTDDLISREELQSHVRGFREKIAAIEEELKALSTELDPCAPPEAVLKNAFDTLEAFADVRVLTNSQLRRIVDKIVADRDGHLCVYLKRFDPQAPDGTVPIPNNGT